MRAGGLDARWLIMPGGADFFGVTKRIHNFLHGHLGDSGPLGEAERSAYERVIEGAGWGLRDVIRPGDVVVLHDPQTLGLASGLKRLGATVMWRCHIGTDTPGGLSGAAWDFLWQYVERAGRGGVLAARERALATAAREGQDHRPLDRSMLGEECGDGDRAWRPRSSSTPGSLAPGRAVRGTDVSPRRRSAQRLRHQCDVLRTGPAPRLGCDQLVVHVCRWDRIKDLVGVMRGFAEHTLPQAQAHLILAGPTVHAITDDPEAPRCSTRH